MTEVLSFHRISQRDLDRMALSSKMTLSLLECKHFPAYYVFISHHLH